MPRSWENVEELYPGYIEEVYGPKTAADGTTREEFYDKNDPKTFRGTTCLSANGNGVESRRDLFKKAVA